MSHSYTPDHAFTQCPFCGSVPCYLPHQAGYYSERVICDSCGFHLHPEKWEARAEVAPKKEINVFWRGGEACIAPTLAVSEALLGLDVHLVQPGGSPRKPTYLGRPASAVRQFDLSIQDNHLDILKNGAPLAASAGQVATYTPQLGCYDPTPTKSLEEVLREWQAATSEPTKVSLDQEAVRNWYKARGFALPEGSVDGSGNSRSFVRLDEAGNLVRHVKSGGIYEVIAGAKMESDLTSVVVYRSKSTGVTWVRPATEFSDGRFVLELDGAPLPPPPKEEPPQYGVMPIKTPASLAVLPLGEMTEEDLMTGDRAFLFGSVKRGILDSSEPTWHQVHRMYTAKPLSDSNNWVTSGVPGEGSFVNNRFTHFLRTETPRAKEEPLA